ncbi:MAG: response regulator [Desulfomonilia bacterium]|jgi:two-component system chemotaxis response regulator CheY|uniref:Response regulatory domain-containing protein n=1 Tax=anaerobic digester metagenome TaxID=1263854 RepID=A0A485LW75_9ZZZZ|nr:response regulator [Pseudomonadota bacterium]HON38863.1 response regulator [Deltaproteobacteria bacterium]HRS56826.1 response regulator [Desulfomonilia bacterium]HPD21991.1 response regulator [Deltaproteobacteria bacterium]HPW69830.1 response regulator [Deltaproteobacteria bacterium]
MKWKILIVDDSNVVKAVLMKALGESGAPIQRVFDASNGREALDILRAESIDLVFADINMPVMNGVELVESMADDPALKDIPVIMISTDGSVSRREYLQSKGVRAYVRKPFTPEQIRSVVREVMLGR